MNSNKNATTINLKGRLANQILQLVFPWLILYSTSNFSAFRCSDRYCFSEHVDHSPLWKTHNLKEPQVRLSDAEVCLFWTFRTDVGVWSFVLFEFLEYFHSRRQSLLWNFSVHKISVLKTESFKTYLKWKIQPDFYLYLGWRTKIWVW